MTQTAPANSARTTWPAACPFYYGWINVVVASVAMTATLPGRTHGLGLVQVPLVADLRLDDVTFARINLVATLAGAAFCIPIGWLIDRIGVRIVLTAVTALLGISVVWMSNVWTASSLLAGLILVRGFGQSALSSVSMAVIGKWFRRRLGIAMGVFAVLLTFGFIGSVLGMGRAVRTFDWRDAWLGLGYVVLGLAALFWLFTRSAPEGCGVTPDEPDDVKPADPTSFSDSTLRQALCTPAFWTIVVGSSAFNLVWSGVTLFNESLLVERGLGKDDSVQIMAILTGVGLLANIVSGALATRERILKLLAGGLLLLAGALAVFPMIDGMNGARVYAAGVGLSGGVVTVIFFAAWGHLFGREFLGRIQGFAQFATVVASAIGPVVIAEGRARSTDGTYNAVFFLLAAAVAGLAVVAAITRLPRAHQSGESEVA